MERDMERGFTWFGVVGAFMVGGLIASVLPREYRDVKQKDEAKVVSVADLTTMPTIPELKSSIVLATIANSDLRIVFFPEMETVCFESGVSLGYAYSCQNTDQAPPKIKRLVDDYKSYKNRDALKEVPIQ